jgi:hypothetical protein
MTPLETFVQSYIATALWSSTDDDGKNLDQRFTPSDVPTETRARMEADCAAFLALHGTKVAGRERLAGYHFWLTRNGHGAGFWDGDWGDLGDALTEASHAFKECDLYVGDDGKLYLL